MMKFIMTKIILRIVFIHAYLFFNVNNLFADDKIINIGFLSPLSGNYAALGEDNRQGAEVALSVSQSPHKFNLVYADSKGV